MSIYTLQYYCITAAEKTQARHPRPRRRLYCHTGGGTPETMEKALIRMLQALSRAALGTGFPFLMTTLGAAVVFFFAEAPRPQFQKTMLGFAAGVMTAASVWSLLLPAIDRAADVGLPGWLPAAVFCVGNALRRGGARGGNLGSAGGGRSAAGDAVAFELCRRSHAVRSGGGAGAPSPFPDWDLRLCGRLSDHDDTGCGAGIGRLVKKETYVAS